MDAAAGADKNFTVYENDLLVDVSGLDSAKSLFLVRNLALSEVVASCTACSISNDGQESRPSYDLEIRAGEASLAPVLLEGVPPQVLRVRSPDQARLRLVVDGQGFADASVAIEGAEIVELGLNGTTFSDWEFLKGFGVPTASITVSGPQDHAVMTAWLEWLQGNGFDGTLAVCPAGMPCDVVE
ncbi:MAG: hypothetical protein IT368_04155 [Candidatus Hydrogenedentes bacterium]|nr:hypothetical protein [Candidatus Hydrogenedentota bacterium]